MPEEITRLDLNNNFFDNFELQENIFNQITALCDYAEQIINSVDAITDWNEKIKIFQLVKNLLSKLNECTAGISKNYLLYLKSKGLQADLFRQQIAASLIDLNKELSLILDRNEV